MKHLMISLALFMLAAGADARTYNEQIAEAMNTANWFALDSIYRNAPKDSIMPFLEVFSRCLIGNRLNRPDVSMPAFEELFKTQSDLLNLDNLLNSAIMYSMDLSRTGANGQAARMLETVFASTRGYIDSVWTDAMQKNISRYKVLSAYKPYSITFAGSLGRVPFQLMPIGNSKYESVLMHLKEGSINGIDADITFDTGAAANIISDSLASKYNLIELDATNTVKGMGKREGRYAIAKELKIGNITMSDVPFIIVSLTTGNVEADQHIGAFSIVVGLELMLQLKDLTIDFTKHEITIPAIAPTRSATPPNLCFSSEMNLLAKGSILGDSILMLIDTGNASAGYIGHRFFSDYQNYITTHAKIDTIRGAGLGGYRISECYNLSDVYIGLGGNTLSSPGIVVVMADDNSECDCNIGIKTLMRFDRLRLNLIDFTITTEPHREATVSPQIVKTKPLPNKYGDIGAN